MLTNEYIAEVVSNFVHNVGPRHYLIREMTDDEDRFFLSEYADHDPAKGFVIWALKTTEGHTIIYGHDRLSVRNLMNFRKDEYLKLLQSEGE